MNNIYLLIGGNLGDRMANLASARKLIEQKAGHISRMSGIYETAPWGGIQQPTFYNQALLIHSTLPPQELLTNLLQIETELGRTREEKYGPRTIDIDILLIDNEIIHSPALIVPHPFMVKRRFVLAPLNEIAGSVIHPQLNKPISKLLNDCEDNLEVKRLVIS